MMETEAKILLVDDEAIAIRAAGKMLADYPNQRFARSGTEALRMAKEDRPDLIILDVDMPGMSGFSVCEALRADLSLRNVPVIMATSLDGIMVDLLSKQRGASDVVLKPLEPVDFRARVKAQLNRGRQHLGMPSPTPVLGDSLPLPVCNGTERGQTLRRTLNAMLEMIQQMKVDAQGPLTAQQASQLQEIEMDALELACQLNDLQLAMASDTELVC